MNNIEYLTDGDFENAVERGYKGIGWYFWDESDGQYCYGPYDTKKIAIEKMIQYSDTL